MSSVNQFQVNIKAGFTFAGALRSLLRQDPDVVNKRPIDLHVSTMPTKFGEKAVIRVIDNQGTQRKLDTQGFSPTMLAQMREIISEKNGVFLVTGPTGSGKSTTLYSCLAEIVSL